MRKILLIILILINAGLILGIENTPVDSINVFPVFSLGIGIGIQTSFIYIQDNSYRCFRYNDLGMMFRDSPDRKPEFRELALLYGRAFNFNTRKRGFISYSAGLSYIHLDLKTDEYNEWQTIDTIGIPLDVNIVKGFNSMMGIGLNLTANFNLKRFFGNCFLSLNISDFRNPGYDPAKAKEIRQPKYISYQDQLYGIKKPKEKLHFCLDFNILNYFLYEMMNQSSDEYLRRSYKGSCGISSEKGELIIPFSYKESSKCDISALYYKMISIGVMGRAFYDEKGTYIEVGLKNYYVQGEEYDYPFNEIKRNKFFLGLGLGKRVYLTPDFYIGTQVNFGIPLGGNDIYFRNFSINKIYRNYLYLDLFVPGFKI
ncbi:MAG: hypothetical protein K9N06_12665 [Candidatus Cloacimonetes bacterium]|nr:hypothetical protein [Candidatus Cloacimonadota bacterium]